VKPPNPQLPPPGEEEVPIPPPLPAMTFTTEKLRSARSDPQLGHERPSPASYAVMERRTSKALPQSWQTKSYLGMVDESGLSSGSGHGSRGIVSGHHTQ
jgi:hypothetical protein